MPILANNGQGCRCSNERGRSKPYAVAMKDRTPFAIAGLGLDISFLESSESQAHHPSSDLPKRKEGRVEKDDLAPVETDPEEERIFKSYDVVSEVQNRKYVRRRTV
jgi:hypothetical protein